MLTMFALALANAKGSISEDEYNKVIKGLAEMPSVIEEVLKTNDQIADLARTFTYARNFLYLGRGYSYPVALEGALKLKEINIQEIKARQGRVIALVSKGDTTISKIADAVIELPDMMECLEPLVATVPLQLLAYHIAVCKGKDVDQPRNLAKSVTVE